MSDLEGASHVVKRGLARAGYTIQEVAEAVPCSEATVWRWIKNNQVETFKIGKLRRITAAGFEKLITPKVKGEEPGAGA
jgi:excisionase family DNA binding protein